MRFRKLFQSLEQVQLFTLLSVSFRAANSRLQILCGIRVRNYCEGGKVLLFVSVEGDIGTDFRSKHMLLVVHVWMIHRRLLKEGKPGLLVQEALFDELWENTSNRIRSVGVNELSVIYHLNKVGKF